MSQMHAKHNTRINWKMRLIQKKSQANRERGGCPIPPLKSLLFTMENKNNKWSETKPPQPNFVHGVSKRDQVRVPL